MLVTKLARLSSQSQQRYHSLALQLPLRTEIRTIAGEKFHTITRMLPSPLS